MKKEKNSIGIKFYVVTALCLFLIGGVFTWSIFQGKEKEQAKEESQTEREVKDIVADTEKEEKTVSQEEVEFLIFDIDNRKEFIDPVLGGNAYKANEAVATYVNEHSIHATKAVCLETSISKDESESTNFYLECNDTNQTLLLLNYQAQTKRVEVTTCDYKKEEIVKKVWLNNGEPAVRDVQE